MDLSGFPTLLDQAFLEYRIRQTRQRLSVSLNSFASFLEFSPTIVNMWLSGKKIPSTGNMDRLIPKLVELLDLEVYDVLGLPRPDLDFQRLTQVWDRLPARYRHLLADQAEKFSTESESETRAPDLPALASNDSTNLGVPGAPISSEHGIQDQPSPDSPDQDFSNPPVQNSPDLPDEEPSNLSGLSAPQLPGLDKPE